jgi:hypothetical protein
MPVASVESVAAEGATPSSSASLRLLEANTYSGFGRSGDKPAGGPLRSFRSANMAFHIRLRLANLDPMRQHNHRLFVQFFRPNGRLYLSRERPELVVAPAGQTEFETTIFGLRLSGAEAVNYPGTWRAVVYIDDERLTEIPFEIEG